MFLIRLWHYLKGYVIIIVTGNCVERFINICTRRQILLWDVEQITPGSVRMKISINGFKKSRTAARKSQCRVRIQSKKGLPYTLTVYRKRRGFLAGILVFAILVYLMASIIWSIDIKGNSVVGTGAIIEQINDMGIYRGTLKRRINPKLIADTLMLKNSELSWVGVEIKGTRLIISVREGVEPPVVIPVDKPCHIIAERDGIVTSVKAKNGLALVKEGDTIIKGQILISGNIESIRPEFGVKQVHAIGEVVARTWYEVKKEVPAKEIVRKRTGNEWSKTSIYFLDFKIPLPSGKNPFVLFESSIFDKAPVIGKKFRLPFGVTIHRFFELYEEDRVLDHDQAVEIARNSAEIELRNMVSADAEVVDKQMRLIAEENTEYLIVTLECVEDIAAEQEIGGD
jgi:similar to stage IV sporulation protein